MNVWRRLQLRLADAGGVRQDAEIREMRPHDAVSDAITLRECAPSSATPGAVSRPVPS
jgi:hypothetical protein